MLLVLRKSLQIVAERCQRLYLVHHLDWLVDTVLAESLLCHGKGEDTLEEMRPSSARLQYHSSTVFQNPEVYCTVNGESVYFKHVQQQLTYLYLYVLLVTIS